MWISVRQINVKWHNLQKSCPVCWLSPLHWSKKSQTSYLTTGFFLISRWIVVLVHCPMFLVSVFVTVQTDLFVPLSLTPLLLSSRRSGVLKSRIDCCVPLILSAHPALETFFLPDFSEQGPCARFLNHGEPGTPMRNANAKFKHRCLATCLRVNGACPLLLYHHR